MKGCVYVHLASLMQLSRKTTLPFELYNGESFEKISVMQVLLTGLVHSQLICDMEWT